ncbi:hypothetical protein ACFYX5_17370 [Streptomyces rubiginosohelvolus]|uniref:hypothetical protein n=1 Tax=Streptomyces rubiginosohelvolus TaxID=67362 RepID=UPI0036A97319
MPAHRSHVVAALGWDRPVLVGRSTGGYAVTAATPGGLVTSAAVCVVDGVVLDDRKASLAEHAALRTTEATEGLRTMFRYGWEADDDQMHAHVEQCAGKPERTAGRAGLLRLAAGRGTYRRRCPQTLNSVTRTPR